MQKTKLVENTNESADTHTNCISARSRTRHKVARRANHRKGAEGNHKTTAAPVKKRMSERMSARSNPRSEQIWADLATRDTLGECERGKQENERFAKTSSIRPEHRVIMSVGSNNIKLYRTNYVRGGAPRWHTPSEWFRKHQKRPSGLAASG